MGEPNVYNRCDFFTTKNVVTLFFSTFSAHAVFFYFYIWIYIYVYVVNIYLLKILNLDPYVKKNSLYYFPSTILITLTFSKVEALT